MTKKIAVLLVPVILIIYGCAHAPGRPLQSTGEDIYEGVLSNGLKVIVVRDSSSPLAVFQIWYDAGSVNEPMGKSGLSHLLEHMMFKGTPRYGPKTFSRIIKRAGGVDNAATSRDFAYYYQKLAPDRLYLSIELESDRMRNLILDADEFESEKKVVMEERRMRYEDDPQSLVFEEVLAAAFKNHPYRRPVIGWMEDLETITLDDLARYYRERYTPNNAFIVVAGNVDPEGIMSLIREYFGKIPAGPELRPLDVREPVQRGERRVFVRKEAQLPYILSAYKVPNLFHEDSYALEVLASVLSEGRSSRIYRSLVDEKRIALSAGAGYGNFYKYPFLFYLYGTAMPGVDVEDVEKALYAEIERIKETPPSDKEIQKAKNQIEAEFIMDQDSIFYRAMIIAEFEMLGGWEKMHEYLDGVRRVTPEDVRRVARRYFVDDNRTVGILIPVRKDGVGANDKGQGSVSRE
jgi:zinc protease